MDDEGRRGRDGDEKEDLTGLVGVEEGARDEDCIEKCGGWSKAGGLEGPCEDEEKERAMLCPRWWWWLWRKVLWDGGTSL